MITIEKIKIFNSYGGDVDGFLRMKRDKESRLIEDNEWSLIGDFLQDMALINKKLAAQSYVDLVLKKMKENCDSNSFDLLTQKIRFYQDFQRVKEILKEIENKVTPDTDTVWAGFDNADVFLSELKDDIQRLAFCDFKALNKACVEFAPTSTYQELSMSNGWSKDYLKLAEEFDLLYDKITRSK